MTTKVSKAPAPVHSKQSVSECFATIMQHNFDFLGQWEQAARSWQDIEGVHQMRVIFRRMRSATATFRSAIPKEITRKWSEEMRWLAGELGEARDLDVFIGESLGAVSGKLDLPGEKELLVLAEAQRAVAYERVRSMLDGERYALFKDGFSAWLASEGWLTGEISSKDQKRLSSNIVPFARKILDKQERRVLSHGAHVDVNSADDMHRLRIECKKMRYAAEFFYPLFTGMDLFIQHMRGLQDLLGIMNDVAVMGKLLEGMFSNGVDQRAVEYAGGVVGWRTREYHDLLETFDGRWNEFVHAKNPWWKKSAIIQ